MLCKMRGLGNFIFHLNISSQIEIYDVLWLPEISKGTKIMAGNLFNGTLVAEAPILNLLKGSPGSRNGDLTNGKGQIQLQLTVKTCFDTLRSWHHAVSDTVLCKWVIYSGLQIGCLCRSPTSLKQPSSY